MAQTAHALAALLGRQAGEAPKRPVVLQGLADLANWEPAYKRIRVDMVGQLVAAHVCPAEMQDGSYLLLVTKDHLQGGTHRELERRLQGMKAKYEAVEISPTLLLTLTRERLEGEQISRDRRASDRSAMASAFLEIVTWGVRHGASDIDLNINLNALESQIRFCIDGRFVSPPQFRMPTERLHELARVAWLDVRGGQGAMLNTRQEQQGRLYEVVDGRQYMLRWMSFAADQGPSICMRVLQLDAAAQMVDYDALGYLPSQARVMERALLAEGGAIVFGGVVGSGKSTTLAHLIGQIPQSRKIMTLEDPVERAIPGALQSTITRNLGDDEDHKTFRSKLLALKRSAVTDVLLGEIRDRVTGRAAIDVIESGSRLYTTTHAFSALAIPDRLASSQIGLPRELLAAPGVLKLLVYQALLPRLCTCALPAETLFDGAPDATGQQRPGAYWRRYLGVIGELYGINHHPIRVRNPTGCPLCQHGRLADLYGWKGRTVVAEAYELAHDHEALRAIQRNDQLSLVEHLNQLPRSAVTDADMTHKSALECAVYKMTQGQLDPRDIEPRFVAFETLLLQRQRRTQ